MICLDTALQDQILNLGTKRPFIGCLKPKRSWTAPEEACKVCTTGRHCSRLGTLGKQTNKQANKQTNKPRRKQTDKQAVIETHLGEEGMGAD
jgi:hypothetical protein